MFESAGVHQHGVTAVKRFVLDGSRNQFVAQACAVLGIQCWSLCTMKNGVAIHSDINSVGDWIGTPINPLVDDQLLVDGAGSQIAHARLMVEDVR